MAETTNTPAPVTPQRPPQRFSPKALPKKTAATAQEVLLRIRRWQMVDDLRNVAASDKNLVKAVQNAASAEAMGCTPPSSKDRDEESPPNLLYYGSAGPQPQVGSRSRAPEPPRPPPHPPGTTPPKWLR